MTAKELIGILLESPFYLDMDLRERLVLLRMFQYLTVMDECSFFEILQDL